MTVEVQEVPIDSGFWQAVIAALAGLGVFYGHLHMRFSSVERTARLLATEAERKALEGDNSLWKVRNEDKRENDLRWEQHWSEAVTKKDLASFRADVLGAIRGTHGDLK